MKEKKENEEQIAEEITITHTTNYYNDSLADEEDAYNDNEENENEEKEDEEKEEENNNNGDNEDEKKEDKDKEDNKEGDDDDKIEDKDKSQKSNKEENINKDIKENDIVNYDESKENENNVINIYKKGDIELNNSNKENNVQNEENDDNENDKNNDKISFCHFIFHKGVDIDISTKKLFSCYEQSNSKTFIIFNSKKYSKTKTLLFFDEQYLYLLKDIEVNTQNKNLRRINDKYDLNKLFDYTTIKKENSYEFCLDFLVEENFLDRKIKNLLFEENEAELFENEMLEILEKIDSIYISENHNEEEEEEENDEEDEKEDDKKKEDESSNNDNNKGKDSNVEKYNKKLFLKNVYGIGEKKDNLDSKSSSRYLFKNVYV